MVVYLDGEEILIMHERIVEATGGLSGLRDLNLFLSLIEKPKAVFSDKELYPTIFLKAAVYLEAVANYHVFVDGNKRTAFASAARFLERNSFAVEAGNRAVENFMLKVARDKLPLGIIAKWLEKNSRPKN